MEGRRRVRVGFVRFVREGGGHLRVKGLLLEEGGRSRREEGRGGGIVILGKEGSIVGVTRRFVRPGRGLREPGEIGGGTLAVGRRVARIGGGGIRSQRHLGGRLRARRGNGCTESGGDLVRSDDGARGGHRLGGQSLGRSGGGLVPAHGLDGRIGGRAARYLADRARRERGHGQNRAERLPRRFFWPEVVHRRGNPPPRVRPETILGPRDDVASGHGRRPLGSIDDDLERAAHRDVRATGLVDDCDKTGQRRQVGGERGRQFL